MDFSSLSGLFVVVGMGVAITMFIPAWVRRSEGVHEAREISRSVKHTARARREAAQTVVRHAKLNSHQLAAKLSRVVAARRLFALGFIGALGAAVFGFANFASYGIVAFSSTVGAIVLLVLNRTLARSQAQIISDQRSFRSVPVVSYRELFRDIAPAEVATAPATDRTWTPRHMPAPLHAGHVGSLEQPLLARVTEIKPATQEMQGKTAEIMAPVGSNLDEILRRRRAV